MSKFRINWHTPWIVIRVNLLKRLTWRRVLLVIILIPLWALLVLVNWCFQILDVLFFWRKYAVSLDEPIFIIANPRSGTTFLHRILAQDPRMISPRLHQTLICSATYYTVHNKLLGGNSWLARLFRPLTLAINRLLFSRWKGIHNTGLSRYEEDEGFWFLTGWSPAWASLIPEPDELRHLNILDDLNKEQKESLRFDYTNFLKMLMLHHPEKRLLIKSVMSSGRIGLFSRWFPNAKFIVLHRDPHQTIPSYVSMFGRVLAMHSPKPGKEAYRALAKAPIDFYQNLRQRRAEIPDASILDLDFDMLVSQPMASVQKVYDFIGLELSDVRKLEIEESIENAPQGRSKHTYDPEAFGLSEDYLSNYL